MQELFAELKFNEVETDLPTFEAIITAYATKGDLEKMMDAFQDMESSSLMLNRAILSSVVIQRRDCGGDECVQ